MFVKCFLSMAQRVIKLFLHAYFMIHLKKKRFYILCSDKYMHKIRIKIRLMSTFFRICPYKSHVKVVLTFVHICEKRFDFKKNKIFVGIKTILSLS